jgi:hypothetical protein
LSRDQRKQIAEDIRNHKSNQRVSPADQFEALALSITAGDCTDYDRARAESYLKAAHAIRQEEMQQARMLQYCQMRSSVGQN